MGGKQMFDLRQSHLHFNMYRHTNKRYKMWWGRASGGSGATAILRVKPKLAMTKIYVAVGGKGKDVSAGITTSNICNAQTAGGDSSIGVDPSFENNICVAAGSSSNCAYTGGTGGEEPVVNTEGLEDIFETIEVIRCTGGSNGTAGTLYNSYSAPSTTEAKSSYDDAPRGYGAGGYNTGNTSYPAINGYIKIEVVE